MQSRLLGLIALQCSMAACGGGGSSVCVHDTDCPSHFCKADGTCGAVDIDASVEPDGGAVPDGPTGLCAPNHDGHLTLAEVPLVPGQHASFLIATNATVNTAGTSNPDGSRSWDLSVALANDLPANVALTSPSGAWWQADFASATYATVLSTSSDLIGVFQVASTGVTLLGVVSPAAGSTKTELTYNPPARVLALPMAAGDTWTSTSTVSGLAQGVFSTYSESYMSRVDQVGTMKTPYGTFPVLRVATDLARTSGVITLASSRTFAWLAECFGTIATITSQNAESGTEFTSAAEARRLAP